MYIEYYPRLNPFRLVSIDVPENEYREWEIRDPEARYNDKRRPGGLVYVLAVCRAGNTWLLRCRVVLDPVGRSITGIIHQEILRSEGIGWLHREGYEIPPADLTTDDRQAATKPNERTVDDSTTGEDRREAGKARRGRGILTNRCRLISNGY